MHAADGRCRNADKKRYLRQSVRLTGLSTPSFQTCVNNIQYIHAAFGRLVPDGGLEPFEPPTFLNHPCMDVATRYYTSRREDPTGTAIPFLSEVDPNGALQAMVTDDHFHGIDNQVLYFTLTDQIRNQKGELAHR